LIILPLPCFFKGQTNIARKIAKINPSYLVRHLRINNKMFNNPVIAVIRLNFFSCPAFLVTLDKPNPFFTLYYPVNDDQFSNTAGIS
jgi:hypothetical protein